MSKLLYPIQNPRSYTRRDPINPAVLVIDMQPVFTRFLAETDKDKIIPAQQSVLKYCADTGIPSVLVEYSGNQRTIDAILNAWSGIPKRICIIKEDNDAFINTELDEILTGWNVKYLILMGINALGCVMDTALSAVESFGIGTSRDVIANAAPLQSSLGWYQRNSDLFDTYEDMIGYIIQNAKPL